jgi:hypothetical protein
MWRSCSVGQQLLREVYLGKDELGTGNKRALGVD